MQVCVFKTRNIQIIFSQKQSKHLILDAIVHKEIVTIECEKHSQNSSFGQIT